MSTIETANALRPGVADTPLDARVRVNTLEDINNIPLPYIGMIVFCRATDRYYRITSLASRLIGALTVPDAAVGQYEEIVITPAELQSMIVQQVMNNPTLQQFFASLLNTGDTSDDSSNTGSGEIGTGLPYSYPEGISTSRIIAHFPEERFFTADPSGYDPEVYEWSDDDVMSIEVSCGAIAQCYAFDGSAVRYGEFNMLCAGRRIGIELQNCRPGVDVTVSFISHGTTVQTQVVQFTGFHMPEYFTRPEGQGNWLLKLDGSIVAAEYWDGFVWQPFPSGGLGPEMAGKYIRPVSEPTIPALACWSNSGVDGIPFLYLT